MTENFKIYLLQKIGYLLKHRATPWILAVTLLLLPLICTKELPNKPSIIPFSKLKEENFAQAQPSKSLPAPDSILKDTSIEPVEAYHGEGEVAIGDSTLPVTLEIIEFEDEAPFVKVTVDSEVVVFEELKHFQAPSSVPKWRGCVEATPVGGAWEVGAGIGYRLFGLGEYNIGPAIIAGETWIAGEARGWYYITDHISIDAGVGYRIGEDEGLHIGVGLGIDL